MCAGVGAGVGGDLFGGSGGDDLAAGVAPFRAEVDDPIGGLDDVEVVLDDEQRAAAVDELAEGGEEFLHVVEVLPLNSSSTTRLNKPSYVLPMCSNIARRSPAAL